jgi:hypothetical protein
VTIDGIAIMYEGRHAIAASGSPSNITIRNCYIKYIGGALSSSTVRLGNGIEFYGSANNILIENNYVAHCYDAGITSQYIGTTATTVNNFVVRYNVVSNCNMNLEWFYNNNGTPIGTGDSIIWDNNTLMYAGQEWSYNQRWGTHRGVHLSGSWKDLALTNCYVRNNGGLVKWIGIIIYFMEIQLFVNHHQLITTCYPTGNQLTEGMPILYLLTRFLILILLCNPNLPLLMPGLT